MFLKNKIFLFIFFILILCINVNAVDLVQEIFYLTNTMEYLNETITYNETKMYRMSYKDLIIETPAKTDCYWYKDNPMRQCFHEYTIINKGDTFKLTDNNINDLFAFQHEEKINNLKIKKEDKAFEKEYKKDKIKKAKSNKQYFDIEKDKNYTFNVELDYPLYAEDEWNLTFTHPDGTIMNIDPTIDACATLASANTVYELNQSVSSATTCFTIGANNITLDCKGYNISYTGSGVSSNYKPELEIYNCNFYNTNISVLSPAAIYMSNPILLTTFENITTTGGRRSIYTVSGYIRNFNITNLYGKDDTYEGIYLSAGLSGWESYDNYFKNLFFDNNNNYPAIFSANVEELNIDNLTGKGLYFYNTEPYINTITVTNSILKPPLVGYTECIMTEYYSGILNLYFYNNICNASAPIGIITGSTSTFINLILSSPKTSGTNIVGGPNIGGNYWTNSTNNGYSDTCADIDMDGICDTTYSIQSRYVVKTFTDNLPLAYYDTTPPQYSLNTTTTPYILSEINHSLYWQDFKGLSGYIFSWCNGTWNGTSCTSGFINNTWQPMTGTANYSVVSKILQSINGLNYSWCVYANDTYGNWNSASCDNPFTYTSIFYAFVNAPTYSLENTPLNVSYYKISGYNCSLYIDNILNSSTEYYNGDYYSILSSNLPFGNYTYYLNCSDGSNLYISDTKNLKVIDLPMITANDNDIYNGYTTTNRYTLSNITVSDNNLFKCYINATCNGNNIYSYAWDLVGSTSAVLNNTIDNNICGEKGFVTVTRECADSHTNNKLGKLDSKIDKDTKNLRFEKKSNKAIDIKPVKNNKIKDVKTKVKSDRISFIYESEKDNTLELYLEGENLYYIKDSKYKGHFVDWQGFDSDEEGVAVSQWIDFNNNHNYDVDVVKISNTKYKVIVDCSKDECLLPIEFESIGPINFEYSIVTYYFNTGTNITYSVSNPVYAVDNFTANYNLNLTYTNDILYPYDWTWNTSLLPAASLLLYGTNITQYYTSTFNPHNIIQSNVQYSSYNFTNNSINPIYYFFNNPSNYSLALLHVKHGTLNYNISIPEYCMGLNITIAAYSNSTYLTGPDSSRFKCLGNDGSTLFNIGQLAYSTDPLECMGLTTQYPNKTVDNNFTSSNFGINDTLWYYNSIDPNCEALIYDVEMYYGYKIINFNVTTLFPMVNNTYNYTSYKWNFSLYNTTKTLLYFNTTAINHTVYQSIINIIGTSLKTSTPLIGFTINMTNLDTGLNYYTNSTTAVTTFLTKAGNYTIFITDNSGLYLPYNTTFFVNYGENYTLYANFSYLLEISLKDEATCGEFNISSLDRLRLLVYCSDNIQYITVNTTTANISITCNFDKIVFSADYGGAGLYNYFRTFISDEDVFSQNIYLINPITTSFYATTFQIDDLLSDYNDVSIWINRNICSEQAVITSDEIDLEQKMLGYLIANAEYSMTVKSSNNPDYIVGNYVAISSGNKNVKLYDVSFNNSLSSKYEEINEGFSINTTDGSADNYTLLVYSFSDTNTAMNSTVNVEIYKDSINTVPIYSSGNKTGDFVLTYNYYDNKNSSLYACRTLLRDGESERDCINFNIFYETINAIKTELGGIVGSTFLNWFIMLLLSTLAIYATVATASYLNFAVIGIGAVLALFGFFGVAFGVIALALFIAIILFLSNADKTMGD